MGTRPWLLHFSNNYYRRLPVATYYFRRCYQRKFFSHSLSADRPLQSETNIDDFSDDPSLQFTDNNADRFLTCQRCRRIIPTEDAVGFYFFKNFVCYSLFIRISCVHIFNVICKTYSKLLKCKKLNSNNIYIHK